jgi:hypothetical protein
VALTQSKQFSPHYTHFLSSTLVKLGTVWILQLFTQVDSYKKKLIAAEQDVHYVAEPSQVRHLVASHGEHVNLSLTTSLIPKNPCGHLHILAVKLEKSSRPVSQEPHCFSLVHVEQPGGQL